MAPSPSEMLLRNNGLSQLLSLRFVEPPCGAPPGCGPDCAKGTEETAGTASLVLPSDVWCRNLSEPAVVADPAWQAEGKLGRQMSEPVKVYMTSCAGKPGLQHGEQHKFAPELDDDEDSSETSAMSSRNSPRASTTCSSEGRHSPWVCAKDLLEPKWVDVSGLQDKGAQQRPSSGHLRKQNHANAVVLHSLPGPYTEELLLEELQDAGFVEGRDLKWLQYSQQGAGFCMMSFVEAGVMRAFLAAFEDRPMRHAAGNFNLTTASPMQPTFSRSLTQ